MDSRLAQIEKSAVSEFDHYRTADRRVDDKEGIRDGKAGRPDEDAERHPFRDRIVTNAQAALRKYRHQLDNYRDELVQREQTLRQDLDERYAAKRDQLITEYKDKIGQIENSIGPGSSKWTNLKETYQSAQDRERHIEADVGRPLRIHLKYVYGVIMAFVALIEIPINRFAFELYFSETPALSLMIALGIGIILMLLAHFTGTWIKRSFGAPNIAQKVAYGIGVVISAGLIFPTIYMIALLRQHYVYFVETQNISFRQLLQEQGVGEVAREVVTTDLGTSGLMLLMVNLLVVSIGVIVAVARHDSHPDYEKAINARARAERRYNRHQARYDKIFGKAKKAHDEQISTLDKQQDRLEREIQQAQIAQQACNAHLGQILQRIVLHLRQRLQAYEDGNERTRDTAAPKIFGRHGEPELRQALLEGLPETSNTGDSDGRGLRAV